jgi:hypothetical protein
MIEEEEKKIPKIEAMSREENTEFLKEIQAHEPSDWIQDWRLRQKIVQRENCSEYKAYLRIQEMKEQGLLKIGRFGNSIHYQY